MSPKPMTPPLPLTDAELELRAHVAGRMMQILVHSAMIDAAALRQLRADPVETTAIMARGAVMYADALVRALRAAT
jgi:hypothetical protein